MKSRFNDYLTPEQTSVVLHCYYPADMVEAINKVLYRRKKGQSSTSVVRIMNGTSEAEIKAAAKELWQSHAPGHMKEIIVWNYTGDIIFRSDNFDSFKVVEESNEPYCPF